MQNSAQLGAKNFGFFLNVWCVRTYKGVSQCGHLVDKGGSIFRDFVWTPFMNGPNLKHYTLYDH